MYFLHYTYYLLYAGFIYLLIAYINLDNINQRHLEMANPHFFLNQLVFSSKLSIESSLVGYIIFSL